jgi:hypothetical protein
LGSVEKLEELTVYLLHCLRVFLEELLRGSVVVEALADVVDFECQIAKIVK